MTPRERQQLAYELAFLPERLNGMWRKWDADPSVADSDELKALDEASMLHLPFPEGRVFESNSIYRIALYQAGAAPYGMRTFIDNVRSRLGRPKLAVREIPAYLLADVALPGYHMPVRREAAG